MTPSIKNVSIVDFRAFLTHQGLKYIGTKDGHEKWSRKDLLRPVVFQTHIDPIPLFIIKNNLRTMGLTLTDLRSFFNTVN
jgi:hypothetical protein